MLWNAMYTSLPLSNAELDTMYVYSTFLQPTSTTSSSKLYSRSLCHSPSCNRRSHALLAALLVDVHGYVPKIMLPVCIIFNQKSYVQNTFVGLLCCLTAVCSSESSSCDLPSLLIQGHDGKHSHSDVGSY